MSAKLGPFMGMNNRREPFALQVSTGNRSTSDYVLDALDVYFSDSGHISRAAGVTTITTDLAGAHSIWSDALRTLYVQDAELHRIDSFSTFAHTKLIDLTTNAAMSYVSFNDEVWLSNGIDKWRLSSTDVVSPWAMATPSAPTAATIAGALPEGKYQIAISYVNAAYEESGLTASISHELTATGGIRVTIPTGVLGATHVRVYVSNTNGNVLTLHASPACGTTTVDVTARVEGATPTTQFLEPLPAGKLALDNGRLISYAGAMLCYSEPYLFGLYDPSKNFIPFADTVSVVVPAQNGRYIAAGQTYWFPGLDIAATDPVVDLLPYGAIPGTAFVRPDNKTVGWMSTQGVIVGDTQGQAKNIQSEALLLDYTANTTGACTVRRTATETTLWASLT